ncbi:MAG TPA: hypothetical protein PLA74_10350 [Syntrophales bacterium]|nr:hypothetical protein [Syntrophales bacterium]
MITSLSRLKAAPTEQDHGVEAVTLVVLNGKMRLKAWLLSFFALCIWLCPLPVAAYEYAGENLTLTLSGYLESGARYACDNDTPDEDPSTELGIDLNADFGSKASFKLFLQVIDDGKVIDPGNGLLFNEFNKIYQDKNPSVDIDEAYLDLFTDSMDFRIGIQKFAWGRLDEINPTDNLNTEDFSQGGTNEENDRKIGVPAVRTNVYTDLVNIELAWIPQYVPYRLPTSEERWFPGVLNPPDVIETDTGAGDIPVTSSYQDIEMHGQYPSHSEYGIRVSKYIAGCDISLSYFRGYNVMPITSGPTDLTITLRDFLALDYSIEAETTLVPEIHKMNVYGFDFTTTLGSFTIRGEYAYYQNRYFNRKLDSVLNEELTQEKQDNIMDDFLQTYLDSDGQASVQTFRIDPQIALQKDSMKYGIGIDYIYGDTSVSVQAIQEFVPGYDDDRPIYFIKDGFDTMITVSFKQFFLQNTLEANLDGAYDLVFKEYLVKPSVKYKFTESLQFTLGAIWLDGKERDSLVGQYQDNDEIYAKLTCYF